MFRLESREQRIERLEREAEKKRRATQEAYWTDRFEIMCNEAPRPMTAGDILAPDNFKTPPRPMIGADIGVIDPPRRDMYSNTLNYQWIGNYQAYNPLAALVGGAFYR